jgi:hypothetical protein
MDKFVKSMENTEPANKGIALSYNRLIYGTDSQNMGEYYMDFSSADPFPTFPSETTIKMLRERGIIGNHDYPVYERGLNPSYINELPPPYDNLYKNIPPPSMLSNKARVMPIQRNKSFNIHPQYINDALKPLNKRFKYFVKPTPSYETQSLLEFDSDKSIIEDFKSINNITDEDLKTHDSLYLYIPANLYTREWHSFNKDFVINRVKNTSSGWHSNASIDPRLFAELKRLYPNASDYVLRTGYASLIKKHKLDSNITNETVADKLIRTNGVIARLATLLNGVANRQQLKNKINEVIQYIPFTYLTSKFPSVNHHLIQRNLDIYKLAFICGSTNETIVNDVSDIGQYINLLIGA